MSKKKNRAEPVDSTDYPAGANTALDVYLILQGRKDAGEDVDDELLAEWEQLALEESWDEEDERLESDEEEIMENEKNEVKVVKIYGDGLIEDGDDGGYAVFDQKAEAEKDPRLPEFIPRYLIMSDERCPTCLKSFGKCLCHPRFAPESKSVKDICRRCLLFEKSCICGDAGIFRFNEGYDGSVFQESSGGSYFSTFSKCRHEPTEVAVGPYKIYCASENSIKNPENYDWFVSMNGNLPGGTYFGQSLVMFDCCVQDFRAPDLDSLKETLNLIWHEGLEKGKKIVVFCTGGHGRTGTFVASLIALVEQPEDPIAALRSRYCEHAVEGLEQREAIFKILGRELPEKYAAVSTAKWSGWKNDDKKSEEKKWWKGHLGNI